jgi:hydroxylaminobenzene mutase
MNIQRRSREILIHGLTMVLVGLVWGLMIPNTPYPRLALGAHIQLVENGLLFAVLATLLLALPHRVGRTSVWVMVLAAWLTWSMALSEVANAWWGTNRLLPIVAHQGGATGGAPWQESIVTVTHIGAALALIAAWGLLIVGFLQQPAPQTGEFSETPKSKIAVS